MFILGRLLIILYCLLWLAVYAGQRFIIFHPKELPDDFNYEFQADFKEGFLEADDQVPINYLHFKTDTLYRGTVLYFHGNSYNLQRWGHVHEDFTSRGFDVFMIDYRAYGKSEGKISEEKMYADARMAYDFLLQKQIAPEKIVIYGRSLGAAVASQLATEVPANQLILESPFNDIRSLFLDQVIILWLPFNMSYHFRNDVNIPKVKYPVTIMHGTEDRIVPYRNAQRLTDKLQAKDRFITIENGGHKNLSQFGLFQQTLDRILLPIPVIEEVIPQSEPELITN